MIYRVPNTKGLFLCLQDGRDAKSWRIVHEPSGLTVYSSITRSNLHKAIQLLQECAALRDWNVSRDELYKDDFIQNKLHPTIRRIFS